MKTYSLAFSLHIFLAVNYQQHLFKIIFSLFVKWSFEQIAYSVFSRTANKLQLPKLTTSKTFRALSEPMVAYNVPSTLTQVSSTWPTKQNCNGTISLNFSEIMKMSGELRGLITNYGKPRPGIVTAIPSGHLPVQS